MTKQEQILQALFTVLKTIPGASISREEVLPQQIPDIGIVTLFDGDPGAPEITMSPLEYHYDHRAEIEVVVQAKTPSERATKFDELKIAIGAALVVDRTLGGLCDWVEAEAPRPIDLAIEGAETLKAATIAIKLIYATADPLS